MQGCKLPPHHPHPVWCQCVKCQHGRMHWLTSRKNMPSSCVMVCAAAPCEVKHIKHIHAHVICSCLESNHVCVCVCLVFYLLINVTVLFSLLSSCAFAELKQSRSKRRYMGALVACRGLRCWSCGVRAIHSGWDSSFMSFIQLSLPWFPICLHCLFLNKKA